MNTPAFKPTLKLLDATMMVAGSMIGSGIFIVSADITRNVGSTGWLLVVWLITGFMTVTAALSYGELSAMYPKAGGQYVYLKEAYNPLIGFLYGWSFFSVIQTATIAAVGVAFAKFTAYLIPGLSEDLVALDLGFLTISPAQLLSIAIITLLTFINTKGIKNGKLIQTTFTLTKLLSLFGLIIFGLLAFKPDIWQNNWVNAWDMNKLNPDGTTASYTTIAALGAIAAAMVGSIFSSDSWNNVTFIAGEIKNPKRYVGLSLFLGTLVVTLVYIATNVMYAAVLPLQEIASADKDRVAVTASHVIFGNAGTFIIALMIMISTFGCNNGIILAGARVYYTMAQDGVFFKKVGSLNKNAVPELGFIVVQMDGMGTANRSKAFHDVCWQNLADAGFPDRIRWIKALAVKYPYVDTTRVGLYGTSAGGQNALGGLLFHPEFYTAAVASCGCHDNRVDKQWWNEQWMGYPVGKHYEEQSNVTNAHKLKGDLLLIVGEADTNVPPESTCRVADALIKSGKTFDFLAVPGMGHSDGGPYGRKKKRDFFVKALLGVDPPNRNSGEL